jgi:uncharacterized oxidoreductase
VVTIGAERLQDFVRDIFQRAGCGLHEAERVAAHLVGANLAGHDSHGVIRVPVYRTWMREGQLHPNREPEVVLDTPVLAVVDAHFGFGAAMAPRAVAIGIEKCRAMGLSAVALRNSGHIGRVGEYAEMAAEAGLVSVHFVNAAGSILVAPFGGVERRFSTAPFSVGIPRPEQTPIILDFATSLVAEGKVLVASRGGKALPPNALIDRDGRISGDPTVLYGPHTPDGPRNHREGSGAIRAFGEHKGSGLALMCELLGGALTGNGATKPDRPFANGMLAFYLDPARIDPTALFDGEVARYVEYVKGTKPVTEGSAVLLPGEPEERTRQDRLANGVPLPDDTWAAIVASAREVGITDERVAAATAR